MSLADIGVKVVDDALLPQGETGMALALLREAQQALQVYLETGENQQIDLKGLPMTAADREQLKAYLGQGEVQASLEVAGPTDIIETRFSGVWWVTHKNSEGAVMAEQLEIAQVPQMLSTHVDDMRVAVRALEEQIQNSHVDD